MRLQEVLDPDHATRTKLVHSLLYLEGPATFDELQYLGALKEWRLEKGLEELESSGLLEVTSIDDTGKKQYHLVDGHAGSDTRVRQR